MKVPMKVAEPITEALASGGPVVALESTIITHGLPSPRNLETAREVEAALGTASGKSLLADEAVERLVEKAVKTAANDRIGKKPLVTVLINRFES